MKIIIGADHRGAAYLEKVDEYVKSLGHKTLLVKSEEKADDYPDIMRKIVSEYNKGKADRIIAICGSGVGADITLNKFDGIYSALARTSADIYFARRHEDVNALALGSYMRDDYYTIEYDYDTIYEIVNVFLNTPFEGGRHLRRLEKLKKIELGN